MKLSLNFAAIEFEKGNHEKFPSYSRVASLLIGFEKITNEELETREKTTIKKK